MDDQKDVLDGEVVGDFDTAPENNTGGAESDPRDQARGETSRKGPYAVHGIFSRSVWRILSKCGEDMRKLSVTERMLYEHYKPSDAFQEFILDRAWACVLRCVLSGREEERIFATGSKPGAERIKDIGAFAAYGGAKVIAEQTSSGLLNELANVLRYDAYYAREFTRWIGFLEELQHGGSGGYVFGPTRKARNGRTEDN